MQLEKLQKHVKTCGFAPVVCSYAGCNEVLNARDLIHHETAVCEKRRFQCHDCAELKHEIKALEAKLTATSTQLRTIEARQEKFITKLELNAQQLEADNREIKQTLNNIVKKLSVNENS